MAPQLLPRNSFEPRVPENAFKNSDDLTASGSWSVPCLLARRSFMVDAPEPPQVVAESGHFVNDQLAAVSMTWVSKRGHNLDGARPGCKRRSDTPKSF